MSEHASAKLVPESARFFAVSVLGVLIDLAIAYTFFAKVGMVLWLAATLGFVVAALVNYAFHELWTFRQGARTLSLRRTAKYLAVSVVTLLSRIAVVLALEPVFPKTALLVLILAAGVSFFVNFILSRILVFSNQTGEGKPAS